MAAGNGTHLRDMDHSSFLRSWEANGLAPKRVPHLCHASDNTDLNRVCCGMAYSCELIPASGGFAIAFFGLEEIIPKTAALRARAKAIMVRVFFISAPLCTYVIAYLMPCVNLDARIFFLL